MKKINLRFLTLATILFFLYLFIPSSVQSSWIKKSSNPVLNIGAENTWDDSNATAPSVYFDGSIFKMWYEGHDGNNWRIGYAFSTDGEQWQKHSSLVIDNFVDVNNRNVFDPSVIFENGNFKMWYAASSDIFFNFHINYTLSTDAGGITWFPSQLNILVPSPSLPWENGRGISQPHVKHFDNKDYQMWYSAHGSTTDWRIGYATSVDGIVWNKHSTNPILIPDLPWEGAVVDSPSVIYEEGVYHMFYHGQTSIGHAWSVDGINWTKDQNPVLTPGLDWYDSGRVMNPYVLNVNGTLYMYYTGQGNDGIWRTGLATSSDPLPGPVITQTPTPTPTIEPTATPTHTPTPTLSPPSGFSPIVIAVGMLASWNPRDIFSCDLSSSGDWKMMPFVHVYDRLTNTLRQNAKLKQNEDFYLYTYDWRQPLDKQAINFADFLIQILKDRPAGTKVRLIGHSFGGLVGRSYLESAEGSPAIEKVMTVGTPHYGVASVFPLWENGSIWEKSPVRRALISQIINHCSHYPIGQKRSKREVIQQLIPSIGNLLPVFDYVKKNGRIIPVVSLFYKNTWIPDHEFPADHYTIPFQTLSGDDLPTIRFIHVNNPSKMDIKQGNWKDGKPVGKEYSNDGDGTVLQISSRIETDGVVNEIIPGDHHKIMFSKQGIRSILKFLGLDTVTEAVEVTVPEEVSTRILSISTDQPVTMEISDPRKQKTAGLDQLIVVNEPEDGTYILTLTSNTAQNIILYTSLSYAEDQENDYTVIKKVRIGKKKAVTVKIVVPPKSVRKTPQVIVAR